jgi:methylated-DNA-protein-cysteine methyltransferase-like protein
MAGAKTKKNASKTTTTTSKQRLNAVKPSGEKDGSMVDGILDLVRQIPKGRVTSYGAIAAALSIPNPRMVGRAMRLVDSKGRPVPAQRVVNSTGHLSGDHQDHRKKLLEKEGIKLKGDKIVDYKNLFWDPAKEL